MLSHVEKSYNRYKQWLMRIESGATNKGYRDFILDIESAIRKYPDSIKLKSLKTIAIQRAA